MKHILLLATLTFTAAAQVKAEDPAILLERAIHLEQTQGDLDGALALYQQVLLTKDATLRAQATRHIDSILAAKRNPNTARLTQFRAQTVARLEDIRKFQPIGEVVNGRFRHFATGIDLGIPAGWSVEFQGPAVDAGDELRLKGEGMDAEIVMIAEKNTPAQIEQRIKTAVGARTRRMHESETESQLHPENHMNWDEAKETKIAGHQAILYTMDILENGKVTRVQYMMDVVTSKSRVQVAGRSSKDQLPQLRAFIDSMIGAAIIP